MYCGPRIQHGEEAMDELDSDETKRAQGRKMTMRYSHLSTEFIKEEIHIMNGLASGKKEKAPSDKGAQDEKPLLSQNVTSLNSTIAPIQ